MTKEITASGIQGRGGAAFPMGRKWGVVNLNDGQPHYLCANADEGEPGTFKDRWILEHAPHLLLESMLIAAYALQVRHAFIYIRGEFDLPYRRLAAALEEAYEAGYFGADDRSAREFVMRSRRSIAAPGSYVCGEASALLTSIEGTQGLSAQSSAAPHRARPLPAPDGRQQRRDACPTSSASSRRRREAFRKVGTREESRHASDLDLGTHATSPACTRSRSAIRGRSSSTSDCGGMLGGRALKAIIPGGISTKVLTARRDRAAARSTTRSVDAAGSSLGSGGMIVIAEGTCMVRLLQVMLRF